MYSQGHYIYSSEYGYNKDNIIVGCMSKEAAAQTASVKNELNNISGVKGVSISYFALNSSDRYMNWERGTNEQRIQFDCLPVDYDFLQLMEIPIIEGRNFRPDDGDVYIFNEAARNKYPIIKINEKAGGYPVIGICKNIRYSSFRNNDYFTASRLFVAGSDYKDRWLEMAANHQCSCIGRSK